MIPILFALIVQTAVSFITLAQGATSGVNVARTVVVRTADEWEALWKAHQPDRLAPVVDFRRDAVIGVFLGSRPTAGFSVAITAITTKSGVSVVQFVERKPDPDLMVAQVLTAPFHLVRVAATAAGTVEFTRGQVLN